MNIEMKITKNTDYLTEQNLIQIFLEYYKNSNHQ